MISAVASQKFSDSHIRKISISRDLDQVADLIEKCFPIHLDQDGQNYIREMRKTAQEMRLLGWLSTLSDLDSSKVAGFVWEEGDQIIGNLSMIPFKDQGQSICLIANVAVDPNFRRQGIGRALTRHTLTFLRNKHVSQVWLQVRDDNPAAHQLYQSTGFEDHVTRTTWRIRSAKMAPLNKYDVINISIGKRKKEDWEYQKKWLLTNYPVSIRWNLPVDFSRFEPGVLQRISNLFEGVLLKHWAIRGQDKPLGVITWQKTKTYANNLWLAFSEDLPSSHFVYALQGVMKHLSRRHPISIDFPKGRFEDEIKNLGFEEFRSLIWMKQNLK